MERRNEAASHRGGQGEQYAAALLEKVGYQILASNFRTKAGEIDLVAVKDGYLAFVEVKTRKAGALSPGYQAVSVAKQKRIIRAAEVFLSRFPLELQPRFDVVCLEISPGPAFQVLSAEYYENAFDVEGISPF